MDLRDGDGSILEANEWLLTWWPTVSRVGRRQVTLAGGDTVQVSITFDQSGNDAILDLFFADGGNVNSTA